MWAVCYRELYERGLVVAQTAAKVIERSQNTQRKCAGEEVDDVSGVRYSLFEERHMKPYSEHFYRGLLDSRSAAQNHQGPTLIQLFSRYGLELSEACGQRNEIQIPRLKDWLRVDFNRPHPWRKGPDGKPMMGAPMLYFFDGRCENVVRELEGLQNDPNDVSKINKKNDHHAVDCCKYWASDAPAYHGDMEWLDEEDKWGEDSQQDKHGGGNGERRFGGLY